MSFPMKPTANPHAAQRAVDAFNAAHPSGTRVLVSFDGGAEREGRTVGLAAVRQGLAAIRVAFVGIAGTFPISRVRRAPSQLSTINSQPA